MALENFQNRYRRVLHRIQPGLPGYCQSTRWSALQCWCWWCHPAVEWPLLKVPSPADRPPRFSEGVHRPFPRPSCGFRYAEQFKRSLRGVHKKGKNFFLCFRTDLCQNFSCNLFTSACGLGLGSSFQAQRTDPPLWILLKKRSSLVFKWKNWRKMQFW